VDEFDKVDIAVYWTSDTKSDNWKKLRRGLFSVFSKHTRRAARESGAWRVNQWVLANGGTFPKDVFEFDRLVSRFDHLVFGFGRLVLRSDRRIFQSKRPNIPPFLHHDQEFVNIHKNDILRSEEVT
jgi:hypothetical protein